MRKFQIIAFLFGVLAFLASACFVGKDMGETLWKVGIAIMIGDIACMLLWPRRRAPDRAKTSGAKGDEV